MSQIIKCCTCLQPRPADVTYSTLNSDSSAANALNLKEKLLYCVPEFEEILSDDGENSWICSICCQALCWAYYFRKMCLDVKNKLKTHINGAKEVEIDAVETNLSDTIKSAVARNEIKTEIIGKDGCRYTLLEIEEPEPSEMQHEKYLLTQRACNTIPAHKENNINLQQLMNCYVRLELLSENLLKQTNKRKIRRKSRRTTKIKSFQCVFCGRRYANLFFLNNHQRTHKKIMKVDNIIPKADSEETLSSINCKFQSLTIKEKLLSEPERKKQEVPPVLSINNDNNRIKNGLLREAILNLKDNKFNATDFNQQHVHDKFGIFTVPSFPTLVTTKNSNLYFINEVALQESMSDYILSVLRKMDPNTVIPQLGDIEEKYEYSKWSKLAQKYRVRRKKQRRKHTERELEDITRIQNTSKVLCEDFLENRERHFKEESLINVLRESEKQPQHLKMAQDIQKCLLQTSMTNCYAEKVQHQEKSLLHFLLRRKSDTIQRTERERCVLSERKECSKSVQQKKKRPHRRRKRILELSDSDESDEQEEPSNTDSREPRRSKRSHTINQCYSEISFSGSDSSDDEYLPYAQLPKGTMRTTLKRKSSKCILRRSDRCLSKRRDERLEESEEWKSLLHDEDTTRHIEVEDGEMNSEEEFSRIVLQLSDSEETVNEMEQKEVETGDDKTAQV